MNGKQYIQAAQILSSQILEPSKDKVMGIGKIWHT